MEIRRLFLPLVFECRRSLHVVPFFPHPFLEHEAWNALEQWNTQSEGVGTNGTTGTNHKLRLIGNYFFSASTLLFALGIRDERKEKHNFEN